MNMRRAGRRSAVLLALVALAALTTGPAAADTYRVGVDGLACPLCSFGLEKALKKVDGVTGVATDLASNSVVVTTGDGVDLPRPKVEAAVKKAGFSLRSFDREATPG